MYVPSQYRLILKGLLGAGLPLASYFVKMPKRAAEFAVLIGGYLTTRLTEQILEGALTPAVTVRGVAVVNTPTRVFTPTASLAQTKYMIT